MRSHLRHPALVGVAAATLALALGGCAGRSGVGTTTVPHQPGTTSPPPAGPSSTTTTSPASPAPSTTAPPQPSTTTPTTPAPAVSVLSLGDTGPRVLTLQQRLTALHYWLGTPDGVFGDSTEQAVYALQKAAGIARDGAVGPQTEAALARGVVPVPRPATGHVVEVDLTSDLLMIVDGDRLEYTLNTSTGGGYTYTSGGVTAVADTPVGVFHVFRQVDALVVAPLGELWRPDYFYEGFAVHGDSYVPPEPVSHGCVRVSNEAIDWIWANALIVIGTEVWTY